jgi:chromosome partitioning protein
MAVKMAFINGKGGCGKTTSIFHVAGVLANRGRKVLVIDLDKQRNTTEVLLVNSEMPEMTVYDVMCGEEPHRATSQVFFKARGNSKPKYYGVDCMVSDPILEDDAKISKIDGVAFGCAIDSFIEEKGYDWMLVDMPPSSKALNDLCFVNLVNNLIAPFSSDIFSVRGYGGLMITVDSARQKNPKLKNLGVYLSRYMSQCSLDKYVREELKKNFGDAFIDIQIPLAVDIRESVFFGRPISYYKGILNRSRTAYENLVKEIEKRAIRG